MSPHFQHTPDHVREPHEVEIAGGGRLYMIAIGVTILLGLVTGLLWIGWRLLQLHVLP